MVAAADLMQAQDLHQSQIAHVEIRTFHNATRLAGHRYAPIGREDFAEVSPLCGSGSRTRTGG
jgi:2-methylcitrate dehydratase PrpD